MGSAIKKTYTRAFKVTVVKYALDCQNISQAARKYDVTPKTVTRWIREYEKETYATKN